MFYPRSGAPVIHANKAPPTSMMTSNTRTLIRRHRLYVRIRHNNLISKVIESSKAKHRNTKCGCVSQCPQETFLCSVLVPA